MARPPEGSAEFAACMGGVRAVYHRPPDPGRPVACVDETFGPPVGGVREPLPPAPGQAERYDGVYVRDGVAGPFLASEPPAGWRRAAATGARTRGGRAHFIRDLLGGRYRAAGEVVPVMDQLDTGSAASPYGAFGPAGARRPAERLEARHTPEHGPWPSTAEIELSAPARDRPERVGGRAAMARHAGARAGRRNKARVIADWPLTTADARVKLNKLYPTTDE